MTAWAAVLVGGAVVLAVSAAGSGLLRLCGPVDTPRERGLHRTSTPTSGGLAMLAAVAAGLIVFAAMGTCATPAPMIAAFALAAALGLIGAIDDVFDIGARRKLMIQVGLSLAFAVFGARVEAIPLAPGLVLPLGPVVGGLGSALWIVVAVNAVNFIDGADGLASTAMAIAFCGLSFVCQLGGSPGLAAVALFGALANAGFLPWNLPRAKLFQGDAGAFFSAALFASLSLAAAGRTGVGPAPLMIGPLLVLPILTDVFLTLIERAGRRAVLLDAHREHLYQRALLARPDKPWAVLAGFTLSMIIVVVIAWGATALHLSARTPLILAPLGLCVLGWLWIDRSVRQAGLKRG